MFYKQNEKIFKFYNSFNKIINQKLNYHLNLKYLVSNF